MIYLDTEVCIFLIEAKVRAIKPRARDIIASNDLLISPMVLLELEFLYEKGRVNFNSDDAFLKLNSEIGLQVCTLSFAAVAERAVRESWTRDPFDRLIVAQAKANGLSGLVTGDRKIRRNYTRAIW